MYVCMYVCMSVYIHNYVCIQNVRMYAYVCIYVYMYNCISSLSSLTSGRSKPPMAPCFSMLSFFFKFAVSSSPVTFVLVFPFLFYPPFFLLLFLFETSPFSLYVPSSSVVSFLLSFLLLPVWTPLHLICALSNWSSPSYAISTFRLVMSSFLRVHVSAKYKVTLQISVFTILFLRQLFNPPLSNSFLLEKAPFPIAILLLICLWHVY